MLVVLLIALVVIGERTSGEIIKDPTLCGRVKCQVPVEQKFKYAEKVYYQYRYRVDVRASLGGGVASSDAVSYNESRLFIEADVTLRFKTPCEGSLRFGNVSITHDRANYHSEFPDRAGAEFKASLERSPVRFAFDDGTIHELCPKPDDEIWALNLRRGVLSMIQNTMLRFDVDRRHEELDVNGICETKYRLHEARRTSLIIHKSKNLASCRHSAKHMSLIQSASYRSPLSRAHALRQPLLVSGSECEVTIDHNVYQKVTCTDHHRIRPLSNGESAGARTEVNSSLDLIGELEESPHSDDENHDELEDGGIIHSKRTTLLYNHAKSQRTIYGELRTTRDLLKIMCVLGNSQELRENFSEVFTKFIHSARMLDYQGLSQLYHRAQGICKTGKKHIINALPFIGSNAAVNVMKDLIIKRYVAEDKVNFWVMAFTLIPRPDRHTIYALAPLLEFQTKIPEAQFILSYSAVIHAYCSNHGLSCMNLEPVRNFMKFIEDNIDQGCMPRAYARADVKQTLEALKAIGNAGIGTETLIKKLRKCIRDESGFIPMEVKIAAIEAHRRLPSCEKSRDTFFLDHYRNFTVDAELRIASYLQVMRCPDYNVVKIIRHTLEEEELNQVGSFVWSHLKNMLSSSSPTRIEIQSLLTDRDLGHKFNSDVRKFSRNYESSFFSEEYNFGSNYQTNVVFSPKSYIPRTVTFNLTFDLFGESVNALEVSVRAEGLEYYAENLFGPKGPFSGIKVADHFRQFLRNFRSARDFDGEREYWKRVHNLPSIIDNNFDHPCVSIGYKVFGNELKFSMLDSDREIRDTLASFNPLDKIKQILSGKEIVHYENTAMLLDSSYVVPTTTGLPVRLDLSGSAACNIKISGIFNSKKFMSDGELEINGNIIPSVSVDITGMMTVDAFYKSAGIKLKSSVYSVGAVEGDLKIKGLRLARLSWKIPSDKMEVFSLTTDIILTTTNGAEYKENPIGVLIDSPKNPNESSMIHSTRVIKNTTCSWSALDRLIGLKLCADYQFPNVTKDIHASYFLLNGPTRFRLSVIKADPTADSYLFEYKWKRTENESTIRVAFDTPSSQTEREISGMISFDALHNNVTLLLKSKGNSLIAQGTYKRTEDETFVDIGLDSNGTKHLDATVGFSRKKAKYGYSYSPKLFLAINNERIVNLSGIIRNQDKNNTSQCDIDLRFETKNLSSHVFGYILKGSGSVSGNIKVEYRFHERSKDEVLQTEFSLINKSTKTLTYKAADMKLHSTAYPQLNIVSGLRYQHAFGHVELQLEMNTSPHLHNADRHKLTAQFVATYSKPYFQTDGANISTYVSITKPAQEIDIKIGVNYYSIGAESKTHFLVRYASAKEITLAVNVIMPRGTLFAIEGKSNLTIPNFNSMLVSAKITERARNEYELDFAGTWFSGHNISAKGTYLDHSTFVVTHHNLKILLKSPSFSKDFLLNCKLYHDSTDLRIGFFVEQTDTDKYALMLNHTMLLPNQFCTFLEGKYKNSTYSLLSNVDLNQQAILKLHFDKWRDVHIIATGINENMNKEYGIEFKWDANRDPSLKFVSNIQLIRFISPNEDRNASAVVHISYPGRQVKASCLLALRQRNNYVIDAVMEWSTNRAIRFTIDTDYDTQNWLSKLKLESQLLTPFENWRKTSLNGKYLLTDWDIIASSSIYWQDSQHIILDVTGKMQNENGITEYIGNFGLLSTVHSVQYMSVNFTHSHVYAKTADSRIMIRYYPGKLIDVKSMWLVENGDDNTINVTGNLQLISPIVNYRKGELKCHFSSRPDWRFYGVSNLDLDKRKYTGLLVGDLARIKESMIQFNITTPFEKYSYIKGRFGLSERNKHVVAEIATPAGPLGIEGICQLFTKNYDFNIKLLLATPIDVLQKALLVAKLNQHEADFRVAYNNITAGFQGVWFYHNITNFHYSYILYTPLQGFHEIGVITKLVVSRKDPTDLVDFDSEFSLRVVELKAGVKAHAGPKPPPPVTIHSKPDLKKTKEDSKQEVYDESTDLENNIYWKADIELDAVIIETIKGTIDFDREGYTDKVLGILKLPPGDIIMQDHFQLEDFFHIKNDLSIDTPFQWASEIISTYDLAIDMQNHVSLVAFNFNIKNHSEWIETGFNINYTYQGFEEGDPQLRLLKLDLKTPMAFLKFFNFRTMLEIDESYYKAKVSVKSVNSSLDFDGSLEQDINYLDIAVQTKIHSPILIVPKNIVSARKDFTDKEKHLEFILNIEEPTPKSTKFQASWSTEDEHVLRGSATLNTWLEPLINLESSFFYSNTIDLDNSILANAHFKHHADQTFKVAGRFINGKVEFDLETPIKPHQFSFKGDLENTGNGSYQVIGQLTNGDTAEAFRVLSSMKIEHGQLSTTEITISPIVSPHNRTILKLNLKKERYGLSLEGSSVQMNGTIKMNLINSYNWDLRINLAQEQDVLYKFVTFMNVQVNGNTTLYLDAETPWEQMRNVMIDGNMLLNSETGNIRVKHHLNQKSGHLALLWRLLYMSDMFANIVVGYQNTGTSVKDINAVAFYINPKKAFQNLNVGFDLDVDKNKWRFGTNVTIGLKDQNNIDAVLKFVLPPPDKDTHNLLLSYHTNNDYRDLSYVIGYSTDITKLNYVSDGRLKMETNEISGHLRLTWGLQQDETLNNIFNITLDSRKVDLEYVLFTPSYLREETLILLLKYDAMDDEFTLINADIHYPSQKRVGSAKISYQSLININGTLNASTSIPTFSDVKCQFIVLTNLKQNKRFLRVIWPNNSALVDSDYSYHSERLHSDLDGYIRVEFPLNTRHIGLFTYGYKKRPLTTTGYSDLIYNDENIMHGLYNSKSDSRAGYEKDRIEISVENYYKPIGIIYVNQYEYSAGNEGTNYPSVEYKEVSLYQLNNVSAFNVSGTSRIRTTHTGQEIELTAVHFNRTVKFRTDYDVLPGQFNQNSWLSLAEDAWVSYHFNILNKTTENQDNQFVVLSIVYPKRNFTLDGSYLITDSILNSEARLTWDGQRQTPRTFATIFDWINTTSEYGLAHHTAVLSFKHPSFEKDVKLSGQLARQDRRDLLNLGLTFDYSPHQKKLLVFSAVVRDESELPIERKYSYAILGAHPKTNFNLNVTGHVRKHGSIIVETVNTGQFKRTSYLPEETGKLLGRVDINKNEVEFSQQSSKKVKYLLARYYPNYPEYVINGSMINGSQLNATGTIFVNFSDKLIRAMVNYTPDGIENLRMYGNIPDVRNAEFNIWRTYDQDLTVSDVSFYLRLNHSRLVTSKIKWRPELKSDIINIIRTAIANSYDELNADIESWRQYIRHETGEVFTDIWTDAQDELSEFLDDLNDLKEIETDVEHLKIYLNNSYNANEFYIKDIVMLGSYIYDELALHANIQSLPNIINEIWEIMGESGMVIRNSVKSIIETIKIAFQKLSEFISAILKGDSMNQIAEIVEKLIVKYDMFVKELHVSFIKYIEYLYNKIYQQISVQWHRFLMHIEPIFIRLAHYLETVGWKAVQEFFNFLYDRKIELIASPYYDHFSNFTQDIDKLYQDIKANDIITNIQKYSSAVIQFIKERYFAFVPFGKELKDVLDEIMSEFKELQKLPSVKYTIEKIQQVCGRAIYLYEYFEVRAKLESTVRLLHSKFMDISQTALQAESRYREAKTKFIYDPNHGLMCLEQKLPMSWHAFNQTPEFQEIPEYRAIVDMGSYFTASNTTFWTLYYQIKPLTEPSNWLPPFKAQAMIVGAQHFRTFDGRHFDFAGSCTYLLARDFVHDHFAILIKYRHDSRTTLPYHKIIVLVGNNALELDIFKDSVKLLGQTATLQLPAELDNKTVFVYQDESLVTVERKDSEFKLECNLKYEVCTLELSGWYFGKTAGLLGTMDNEQINDVTGSQGHLEWHVGRFARSWALGDCESSSNENVAVVRENEPRADFCRELFTNKSSEFSSCFSIVEPTPYRAMCANCADDREACGTAMSYLQTCMFHDTYLRIPDRCTPCGFDEANGAEVPEGDFRKLEGETVPKSTDIIFIVEAKDCNLGVRQNLSIDTLITHIDKELNESGLVDNRWSLVIFGGDGVYAKPRSLILDNQIFTHNATRFTNYFDHIPVGDGSQDIFEAIRFAAQLVFRAGVSKTFVLMACSQCEAEKQTLDYSVLYHALQERGVRLHILMDGKFELERGRLGRLLYGVDAARSYTKKDARGLVGDVELRRQVKLPRGALGYCAPLALETNGTIFSGGKLRERRAPALKKFASVFAKRLALTASPSSCQLCECIANNDGLTKMECAPCDYPLPIIVDFGSETSNEDDLTSIDVDYGQVDEEEV